MADGSDVEITDGANVTIEETKTSGSTQAGRGVTQHGDRPSPAALPNDRRWEGQ